MGKTVFMLRFIHSARTWFHGQDIPGHQFYLMVACLGQVTTGKLGPLSKIKGLEFAKDKLWAFTTGRTMGAGQGWI
jgi:hypothetical protein